MKKLGVVLITVLCLAGCKRPVAPPPPPPAAPEAPPQAPPPPAPEAPAPEPDEYARLRAMSAEEVDRLGLMREVLFDYDRAEVRADQHETVAHNAEQLRRFDFLHVVIEGHCDERGTVEYNLALGERRARALHGALVALGADPARLRMTSYGKEAPVCTESSEDCWGRNRRGRLKVVEVVRP